MAVFQAARRDELREELLRRARAHPELVAGAVTGSRAEGREDRWSDIDLFLGVREGVSLADAVEDWSRFCYGELGAVHHFDLASQGARYRAFLLADGLQVDLGFTSAADFGPVGDGAFDVVFGVAGPRQPRPPDVDFLVGMAWHHVLHTRAAIERGTPWRAEYWIASLRDVVLSLASVRHGLPHTYARSADLLPEEVTGPIRQALVRELTVEELDRALQAATCAVLVELRHADPEVAERLAPVLGEAARVQRWRP